MYVHVYEDPTEIRARKSSRSSYASRAPNHRRQSDSSRFSASVDRPRYRKISPPPSPSPFRPAVPFFRRPSIRTTSKVELHRERVAGDRCAASHFPLGNRRESDERAPIHPPECHVYMHNVAAVMRLPRRLWKNYATG